MDIKNIFYFFLIVFVLQIQQMIKGTDCHVIYGVIIFILLAVIVRLATNQGKLTNEEYYQNSVYCGRNGCKTTNEYGKCTSCNK